MYDAREDDDDAISWLITLVSSCAHALSYTLSFSLSLSKATALNTLSRLVACCPFDRFTGRHRG